MEKRATQLLNSLSTWAKENPDSVKGILAAGGIGSLIGAALPVSSDDKEESASSRVLRRLRNALIGGAIGAGASGLLNYGMNQFSTAIPANEPKSTEVMGDALSSGLARTGYGIGAAGLSTYAGAKINKRRRDALVKDLKMKGNSLSSAQKLRKAYKANDVDFSLKVKNYLEGAPMKEIFTNDPITGQIMVDSIPEPKWLQGRLANMGVLTEDSNRKYLPKWFHLQRLPQWLKHNKLKTGLGAGATILATLAPDIVSAVTGD